MSFDKFYQSMIQVFNLLSVTELILLTAIVLLAFMVIYLILKMKKLSFNYYAKSVSKTVESQSTKIAELEHQIKQYKRKETGVVLDWAKARDDRSAYLLSIYNDSAERIFNVEVRIDQEYQMTSKIFWKANKIDSQKSINAFFIPGGWNDSNSASSTDRGKFLEIWMQNDLKPIKFTVLYTETPSKINHKTVEINFKKEQLSGHFKRRLQGTKTTPHLAVLSKHSSEDS